MGYVIREGNSELLNRREDFDYGEAIVRIHPEAKPLNGLLTAGEVYKTHGVCVGSGPFGNYVPSTDVDEDMDDNSEESEGFEDEFISSINEYICEGQEDIREEDSMRVDGKAKNYKFFDKPQNRNASSILANLQDTALPLDGPIMFEKTTVSSGKVENKKAVFNTSLNDKGQVVPARNYRTVKYSGEYYSVNKEVVGWDLDEE